MILEIFSIFIFYFNIFLLYVCRENTVHRRFLKKILLIQAPYELENVIWEAEEDKPSLLDIDYLIDR